MVTKTEQFGLALFNLAMGYAVSAFLFVEIGAFIMVIGILMLVSLIKRILTT